MGKIHLHEFRGKDLAEKLSGAAGYLREYPGSTLIIEPGDYVLTTKRARDAQDAVMNGEYGKIPQLVMFQPDYPYDRGLDLDGVRGCRIEAYGARFIVDGFMEVISVRNCKNAEILGLTVDHRRKPYSRGTVKALGDGEITVCFGKDFPITPKIPHMRACLCDKDFTRLEKLIDLVSMEFISESEAVFKVSQELTQDEVGRELYIWHTYHSRPAILIENAENTLIKDVTINSQPGMGITAHHSENIRFERLRVVPSPGECMSTNTDATHLASCRGKVKYDGCIFVGQGDDSLNVHTYYHTVLCADGCSMVCRAYPPDGTHTQVPDYFRKGDTILKVCAETLEAVDTFKALSVTAENGENTVVLDKEFGVLDGFFAADRDAVPSLEIVNCTMKNHLARGALIKCPKAKIENCTIEGTFNSGVKIAPEASWKEGIATDEVTIRNCIIKNCDTVDNYCGGICMYAECADRRKKIHGKITVENCVIDCPDAQNAVIIENTKEIYENSNTLICKN